MKTKRFMILLSAVLSLAMLFSVNSANAVIYSDENTASQKNFEKLDYCLFGINETVYLYKEGKEKIKKVVDFGKGADNIAFSPDGDYIAYSMIDAGTLNVYLYDIASKTSRKVIDNTVGNSVENLKWINNHTIISEFHINPSTSSFYVYNIETKEVKEYFSSNFQTTSDGKHVIYTENRPHFGENTGPYKLLIDDMIVYQSEDFSWVICSTVISDNSKKVAFIEEKDDVSRLVIASVDFDAKKLKIQKKIAINKDISGNIYFEGDNLYILSEDCIYQVDEQNAKLIRKDSKKDIYSAKETNKIAGLKNAVFSMYKIDMSEVSLDMSDERNIQLVNNTLSKAIWTNSKAVIDNFAETEKAIKVFYKNKQLVFNDVEPIIKSGRTLIPLRAVSEYMGAKVDWDDTTKAVIIKRNDTEIKLFMGSSKVMINGVAKELDSAPEILNGRTIVPIRFISESMGMNVQWKSETNSVSISEAPLPTASNQPEEVSLPLVEKVDKIQDFNGSYWISDHEILGFGNSTIPKPEGPNITYPCRPVQLYNTLDKSNKSIDDGFVGRFESFDISPDKKNVFLLSKGRATSVLNIESKKFTGLKNEEPFICYTWLNNNEFIYLALESRTVHKYNLDGSDTKIKTLDEYFNSMFKLEDRIYLIQSISDGNRNAVYYTDTSFSELHKLGEFDGYISFFGNEIILKKIDPASESTSSKAASDTYNYSIVRLDKDFKEKDNLIDGNVEVIDVNENNILYLKNTHNKSQLYSMNITSKKTVELYSSTGPLNSYNNGFFGISSNHKQIFLNFVYDAEINKTDRYETVVISLK